MLRKSFSPLASLNSFNNPEITSLLLTVNRLKTFKEWPFDNISSAKCTSIEVNTYCFLFFFHCYFTASHSRILHDK